MNKLKELRLEAGLTQVKLAELCGVRNQRISDWESGKRPVPLEILDRLSTLLQSRQSVDARVKMPRKHLDMAKIAGASTVQVDEAVTWLTFPGDTIEARYCFSTRRPPDYFLGLVRVDAQAEIGAWRELVEEGGTPCLLSPVLAGFPRHPLVDGSGRPLGVRSKACFSVSFDEFDLLLWPQIWIRTEAATFRVDALMKISSRSRVFWAVLEINGPTHEPQKDQWREQQLDLPVFTFMNQEATSGRFTRLLKERIHSAFSLDPSCKQSPAVIVC